MSRQLRRLDSLGLIKRVAQSDRYYLIRLGPAALAAACSLNRFNIFPTMPLRAQVLHDPSRLKPMETK